MNKHLKKSYSDLLIVILGLLTSQGFSQNTWKKESDIPGDSRYGAVAFSIGDKGYLGTGSSGANRNDFWEYDPSMNTWSQKANFGGTKRKFAVGFSIGNKGYIATGDDGSSTYGGATNDIWEYDPNENKWTPKAPFPGTPRFGAVGFSIGSKGYIGTGHLDPRLGDPAFRINDFWEFDPNDGPQGSWTEKNKIGGSSGVPRAYAVGFSIGNKGYIGTGNTALTPAKQKDFWEYDPSADTWTRKSDFGGPARFVAFGLSIGLNGYIGAGDIGGLNHFIHDFWEFNPESNTWVQKDNLPDSVNSALAAFSIGDQGFIGSGTYGKIPGKFTKSFWQYTPAVILSISEKPGKSIQEDFSIRQNSGQISITSNIPDDAEIDLRNLMGQVIQREHCAGNNTIKLNSNSVQPGIYILDINYAHKHSSKKILIN